MIIKRGRGLATATVATAAVAVAGVVTGPGATARPAVTGTALVVTVNQAHGQMVITPSRTIPAGWVTFNYSAHKNDHTLQAVQLHSSYTVAQFTKDVRAGLEKSNLNAIHRLDNRVTWLGGTESRFGKLGRFTAKLPTGTVYLFDTESNARAKLTVTSPASTGAARYAQRTVTATKSMHWHSPTRLLEIGWLNIRNTSHQPHVLVVQRVDPDTTAAMVRAFIKSGSHHKPSWQRHSTVSSGVFSPGTKTQLHLRLPRGKYLLLCYWPSKKTGMPHYTMGMWKLVHLRRHL
jgi:hypothetical protein